jgi:hypothetical protein
MDKAKESIVSITSILVSLLTLAIVASVLVGPNNMLFFGNVINNMVGLISSLGSNGLAGLIALGVILHLFGWTSLCSCSSK